MAYDNEKMAGALLFLASVQFLLFLVITEALYPGYSVSQNYISDLGVGSTALLFNTSVFILGILTLAGTYFVHRVFTFKLFTLFLVLTGIGAMGVGLFPEDAGAIHGIFAMITFLFGGLSAVVSYKFTKPPLSYFSVILGVMALVALVLFASGTYLGLGVGGMERMIAHPALLWGVSFGSSLMGSRK